MRDFRAQCKHVEEIKGEPLFYSPRFDGIHEQIPTPELSFFHHEWADEPASKVQLFQESDRRCEASVATLLRSMGAPAVNGIGESP